MKEFIEKIFANQQVTIEELSNFIVEYSEAYDYSSEDDLNDNIVIIEGKVVLHGIVSQKKFTIE